MIPKKTILIFLVLYMLFSFGHMKPAPSTYQIQFHEGSNWNKELHYKKQKFIGEHVSFLKNLYFEDKIVFSGASKGSSFRTLYLAAHSEDEVKKILSKDPAIKNGILNFKLTPFVITMRQKHHHNSEH